MSIRTTYLGPRVSMRTTLSDSGATLIHEIPSGATLLVAGQQSLTGDLVLGSAATLDARLGRTLSRVTTASLTSATLRDGELAIGALSVSSIILYYRSGNTTYRILANSAAVL